MTPEEVNIVIGRLNGWEFTRKALTRHGRKNSWEQDVCRHPRYTCGRWRAIGRLQRFNDDLNAIHEAVCGLSGSDYVSWCVHLNSICGADEALSATAPQRCEAFLRTKGLWRD